MPSPANQTSATLASAGGEEEAIRFIEAGNAAEDAGRLNEALVAYDAAVRASPDFARAHVNRGNALAALDRHAEAFDAYEQALDHRPDHAGTHVNIANLHFRLGQTQEAVASYRRALQTDPQAPRVHFALGIALQALGRLDEAIDSYQSAARLDPAQADVHVALGKVLRDAGRFEEALASFRRAVAIDADDFEARSYVAYTLRELRRNDEAIEAFEAALRLRPEDSNIHTGYGILLHGMGRLVDAIARHRKALETGGDRAEVRNSLGNALMQSGMLAEATEQYRRAIDLRPQYWLAHSNLLFAMNYATLEPAECLEMARSFGRSVAAATPYRFDSWPVDRRPSRLRVGMVSGDLCGHPVGYFLESVLGCLGEGRIELVAYPTFGVEDGLTRRIRPAFAAWKPLTSLSDEVAARLIWDDGVHVLLDLAGHTGHNRLPVFAFKPAPVQASWLGYFATTGLDAMDYFICDRHIAPGTEALNFTEELWRLPDSYLCFSPPSVDVAVAPLPAAAAGHVTFGCLNNLAKINDGVVRLWARVLREVPSAKLFLKASQLADPALREKTYQRFEAAGLSRSRLTIEGHSSRREHLDAFGRVDIALDPFPYPGGTTTAEAYWMGVPTITRRGDRVLSRTGETVAQAAGMPEWIADDDDEYVAKAASFATDFDRLARIRASLRQRVKASPLFDAPRFARALESVLWGMWESRADGRSDALRP